MMSMEFCVVSDSGLSFAIIAFLEPLRVTTAMGMINPAVLMVLFTVGCDKSSWRTSIKSLLEFFVCLLDTSVHVQR